MWTVQAFEWKPVLLPDNCVVNGPIEALHQSALFPIIVFVLLFGGLTMKVFCFDWRWPDNMKAFRRSPADVGQGTVSLMFAVSQLLMLFGHLYFLTAYNVCVLKRVVKNFDFLYFTFQFVLLGVFDAYDLYKTQAHIVSKGAIWLLIPCCYLFGALSFFANDALPPNRGGMPVRATMAFFALAYVVVEMLMWRWVRQARDVAIELPFFYATVGSMAATNCANNIAIAFMFLVSSVRASHCIHVIRAPVDLAPLPGTPAYEEARAKAVEEAADKGAAVEGSEPVPDAGSAQMDLDDLDEEPAAWKLDTFEFTPYMLADDCIVNNETWQKFQGTIFFPLIAIGILFCSVLAKFFCFDWDWPSGLSFLRAEDYKQGTTAFVLCLCGFFTGNALLWTAYQKQLLKVMLQSPDFIVLTANFVLLGIVEIYDLYKTQTHVLSPGVIWILIPLYFVGSTNMFGSDVLSPNRGGGRKLRTFFFMIASVYCLMEMILWRWLRRSRDIEIRLPFFFASVGGVAATIAFNNCILCLQLLVSSVVSKNSIFVLSIPLHLFPATDDDTVAAATGSDATGTTVATKSAAATAAEGPGWAGYRVRARWGYAPRQPDELAFDNSDELLVFAEDESPGWLVGRRAADPTGALRVFPSIYLGPEAEATTLAVRRKESNIGETAAIPLQLFPATDEDTVAAATGSDATGTTVATKSVAPVAAPATAAEGPGWAGYRVRARWGYVPRQPDELAFDKEELLVLAEDESPGWLVGRRAADPTGPLRVFPSNYLGRQAEATTLAVRRKESNLGEESAAAAVDLDASDAALESAPQQ